MSWLINKNKTPDQIAIPSLGSKPAQSPPAVADRPTIYKEIVAGNCAAVPPDQTTQPHGRPITDRLQYCNFAAVRPLNRTTASVGSAKQTDLETPFAYAPAHAADAAGCGHVIYCRRIDCAPHLSLFGLPALFGV